MPANKSTNTRREELLRPREAALLLKISGHQALDLSKKDQSRADRERPLSHPRKRVDRFLTALAAATPTTGALATANVSGRNQRVGRIVDIRISGLMPQVTLTVGGQRITSIITSGAVHV